MPSGERLLERCVDRQRAMGAVAASGLKASYEVIDTPTRQQATERAAPLSVGSVGGVEADRPNVRSSLSTHAF